MYESVFRGQLVDVGREAVGYHRDSRFDFLSHHERDAQRALRDGMHGVRELAPYLFDRVADARTLRLSWDYLACNGGQAPGRNGRRYSDYCSAEVWDLCKCLTEALRCGKYYPGPVRIVEIKKSSGGTRPLVLLNIADRVVQRAVVIILQPLLDALFDTRSFGYRPKQGHLHALALGEYLTVCQGRRVWITQDIKDAFGHVPVSRLLQVVNKILPDAALLDLLDRILTAYGVKGLPQGGPLSPLMLNTYCNHVLDRPWRRKLPRLPMLRVADDLLITCYSEKQAVKAHEVLTQLLLPAGLPLKYNSQNALHDLGEGVIATWLGFNLSKTKGGLAAEIGIKSWDRLEECLAVAHTKSDSPVRAIHTIKHWLDQRGPCYPWSDRDEACQKIIDCAHQQGFEELPTIQELKQRWQGGYARWCRLRKEIRVTCCREAMP